MMQKLNLLMFAITLITLIGCNEQQNRALAPASQAARIDNTVVAQHTHSIDPKDEYVNRIAKRILIVSDQPGIDYNFKIVPSEIPALAFDQETNSILVSSNLLKQLHDEAELATVLSLGVAKYSNNTNPDRFVVENLYRAGYDPQALVDLQEQYLNATEEQNYWLGTLYSYPITPGTITYNKALISNMPQGLLRGGDNYNSVIR